MITVSTHPITTGGGVIIAAPIFGAFTPTNKMGHIWDSCCGVGIITV
jgi:hypothetical protein